MIRIYERLELDEMTLETTRKERESRRFELLATGVCIRRNSITGKRDGDLEFFPWHRVQSYREWREVVR